MFKKYFTLGLSLIAGLLASSLVQAAPINALLHNPGDPVVGNPRGKVTVVEFFDYQCSHCVSMATVMENIIRTNPNVRIVFKDLPIRGPMSVVAARAALAANKQDKYYPFSRALLITDQALTETSILQIAKQTGLNIAKLKTDMNSASVKNAINNTQNLAETLNVTGTPAFFIAPTNTQDPNQVNVILGEMSQNELQSAIDKAQQSS